ncbi:MAG: nicotinate-nucleotide--dimethylbenzimidazole phosphoribosyltransferase, partial [Oscillospiraceae bacterium]|nr:nicotinate-nucleotide--dimethylbenzimidazole phosphoribosyltransferase [Oscillospiraceae bacterium]
MDLYEIIDRIPAPDEAARAAARARWDSRAKPLGGLGLLETAIEDASALTGSADVDISARAALVFCADNGVVA